MERRKIAYPGVWLYTSYGSVYAKFKPSVVEIMTRPEQAFLIDGERGIVALEIKKNDAGMWLPQKLVVTQPRELDPKTIREIRGVLIERALTILEEPQFVQEIERVTVHNMMVDAMDGIVEYTWKRNDLNLRLPHASDEATRCALESERDALTEKLIACKEDYRALQVSMETLLAGDVAEAA